MFSCWWHGSATATTSSAFSCSIWGGSFRNNKKYTATTTATAASASTYTAAAAAKKHSCWRAAARVCSWGRGATWCATAVHASYRPFNDAPKRLRWSHFLFHKRSAPWCRARRSWSGRNNHHHQHRFGGAGRGPYYNSNNRTTIRLALVPDTIERRLRQLANYAACTTQADHQTKGLLSTYTPYPRESVFPKSLTELYKPHTLRHHHYIPPTRKAHTFPIAPTSAVHPSSVSFRKITQRAYHTTKPAHRTILTGAVVTAFFQIARSVITALPILWRWQWFTAYPRAMWSLASIPVIGAATIAALALEQHPLTLRNRLMFIDEPTELKMAEQSYADLLKRYQLQLLPEHHPNYRDIQRVADSLLSIVGPVRDWKLHVIDDDAVINAFVTPTGKIFVFTGLLQNSVAHDSVAAILAHELAHVLSRHGAEKLGFQYVARLFSDFLHSLLYTLTLNLPIIADLGGRTVDATKHLLSTKPYSRMCESEADSIGLYLMSMAGWNPHAAVEFWDEMSLRASSTENAQSATTCEFLSDHPAHTTRADDLRNHLPTALKIYHSRQQAMKQFSEEIAYENTAPLESLNRALHNVLVMHAEKDPWDLDYMGKVDARVAI